MAGCGGGVKFSQPQNVVFSLQQNQKYKMCKEIFSIVVGCEGRRIQQTSEGCCIFSTTKSKIHRLKIGAIILHET